MKNNKIRLKLIRKAFSKQYGWRLLKVVGFPILSFFYISSVYEGPSKKVKNCNSILKILSWIFLISAFIFISGWLPFKFDYFISKIDYCGLFMFLWSLFTLINVAINLIQNEFKFKKGEDIFELNDDEILLTFSLGFPFFSIFFSAFSFLLFKYDHEHFLVDSNLYKYQERVALQELNNELELEKRKQEYLSDYKEQIDTVAVLLYENNSKNEIELVNKFSDLEISIFISGVLKDQNDSDNFLPDHPMSTLATLIIKLPDDQEVSPSYSRDFKKIIPRRYRNYSYEPENPTGKELKDVITFLLKNKIEPRIEFLKIDLNNIKTVCLNFPIFGYQYVMDALGSNPKYLKANSCCSRLINLCFAIFKYFYFTIFVSLFMKLIIRK